MESSFARYLSSLSRTPVVEAAQALYESASNILYHFINARRFCQMIETNRFTPAKTEQSLNGHGINFMSFARHGNFNEGYPAMMYAEGGIGDPWCKIRLTIDGDKFNRQPNFHTEDGRQYSATFQPFDWIHHVYKDTPMKDTYPSGRDFKVSNDVPMVDYSTMKPVTDESHPFYQSEDRMTTTAEYIPNAFDYINRVDIIVYVSDFDRRNQEIREQLYNDICGEHSDQIHVYNGMEQFKAGVECSKSILTAPCENRVVKLNARKLNEDGTVNYEYRSYPRT